VRVAELERRIELLEAAAQSSLDRARSAEDGLARLAARAERLQWLAAPGLEDLSVPEGGRTGLTGSGSGSRVLCSAGTGADGELMSVTGAAMALYAYRWGWDVSLSGETGDEPPAVRRLRFIRELCDQYAWVLWIDPGASIVDVSADVLAQTRPDRDIYVCAPVAGEPVGSRPVMLVRASDLSRRLLDHLIEHPDAEVGPPRHAVLPAAWAWSPGMPAGEGPHVMLPPEGGPLERRLAALERLAALRRSLAALPGVLGDAPGALAAFGPARAAEVPDLLDAMGLTGTAVVVGSAPDGFRERLTAARGGAPVVLAGEAADADDAAGRFADAPPDVVWLLGGGRELALTQRLMAWWPVLRPGGLMLGHPYTGVPTPDGDATAGTVDWFFGELGLGVHVTTEDPAGATWMVRKPVE